MRIGELARRGGVGVETIRYYQRIRLLPLPERPYGASRSYAPGHLQRLRFIRRAQGLGFSLDEIASLLRLTRDDCRNVQALAAAAGHPARPVRMLPQPGDQLESLPAVGGPEQRGGLGAGVHDAGLLRPGRRELPHPGQRGVGPGREPLSRACNR